MSKKHTSKTNNEPGGAEQPEEDRLRTLLKTIATESLSESKKKKAFTDLAKAALEDEEGILHYYDSVLAEAALMADTPLDFHILEVGFCTALRKSLHKVSEEKIEALYDTVPTIFEHVVEGEYATVATAVLGGLFDRYSSLNDPSQVADLGYVLAKTALDLESDEALKVVTRMLRCENPATAFAQNSKIYWSLFKANHWVYDDDVVMKAQLCAYFAFTVGDWLFPNEEPVSGSSLEARRIRDAIIRNNTRTLNLGAEAKMYRLYKLYGEPSAEKFVELNAVNQSQYPHNLFLADPNQLYERVTNYLIRDQKVSPSGHYAVAVVPGHMPYVVEYHGALPFQKKVNLEIRNAMFTGELQITDARELQSFLENVGPEFPSGQESIESRDQVYVELELEHRERLRMLTKEQRRALPSKRVLSVSLAPGFDSELDDRQISEIEFEKLASGEISVRIYIGKSFVSLVLKDFDLVEQQSGIQIWREPVKANRLSSLWWENRIYNILQNYMCAEVIADETHAHVGSNGELINRVGHMRRLQEGEKPGAEQYQLAMDEQGWDMREFNMGRDGSADNPFYTYVRQVVNNDSAETIPPLKWRARPIPATT